MEKPFQSVNLSIAGLGIIFCSPGSMPAIQEGEDFLSTRFMNPGDVAKLVCDGRLPACCTGTPGRFVLHFFHGYPSQQVASESKFCIRLAIVINGGAMWVRDLYDLMAWTAKCSDEQVLRIADGIYHLTICTNPPTPENMGCRHAILVFMEALQELPKLGWTGVPMLCD